MSSAHAPFEVVRMEELEPSFWTKPTKADTEVIVKKFKIPIDHIKHEILFPVPDCALGIEYLTFVDEHIRQHGQGTGGATILQARTMPVKDFIDVHGMDGLRRFMNNMRVFGSPYQPVRLVRDDRIPVTTELVSNLVCSSN